MLFLGLSNNHELRYKTSFVNGQCTGLVCLGTKAFKMLMFCNVPLFTVGSSVGREASHI